uniref:META domain-containing protein n=1 Tax=Heterorhabditis bacteriophora TaxID=37862 RepID=A0A1I7WDG4_HETBA
LLGDEYANLTILARNNTGYHNLTLLISEGNGLILRMKKRKEL